MVVAIETGGGGGGRDGLFFFVFFFFWEEERELGCWDLRSFTVSKSLMVTWTYPHHKCPESFLQVEGAWSIVQIQINCKCGSGADQREVFMHRNLFVVEHDERHDPWSKQRFDVGITSRRLTAKCTLESLTRALVFQVSGLIHTTNVHNLQHRLKVIAL